MKLNDYETFCTEINRVYTIKNLQLIWRKVNSLYPSMDSFKRDLRNRFDDKYKSIKYRRK